MCCIACTLCYKELLWEEQSRTVQGRSRCSECRMLPNDDGVWISAMQVEVNVRWNWPIWKFRRLRKFLTKLQTLKTQTKRSEYIKYSPSHTPSLTAVESSPHANMISPTLWVDPYVASLDGRIGAAHDSVLVLVAVKHLKYTYEVRVNIARCWTCPIVYVIHAWLTVVTAKAGGKFAESHYRCFWP